MRITNSLKSKIAGFPAMRFWGGAGKLWFIVMKIMSECKIWLNVS